MTSIRTSCGRRSDVGWLTPAGAVVALAWALGTLLPCVRVGQEPTAHSVYPIYAAAGRAWNHGGELYRDSGYRYSPLVAAFFSPWGRVSDRVAAPLWHLLNAAVYLAGLVVWARHRNYASWPIFFILALPPSLTSLNNGQANALVLGLILLALDAAERERWNWSAGCVVLATAFKIYPLLIGLFLLGIYPRRLFLPLASLTVLVVLLPFVLQNPLYVGHEYATWLEHLRGDDRQLLPLPLAYRDLRLLLRTVGLPISRSFYFDVEMLAAGAIAGYLTWRPKPRLDMVLALGTLWMTVLGPSTEACTYIFLAPVLAELAMRAWQERRSRVDLAVIAAAYLLITYPQLPYPLPGAGTLGRHAAQCLGGLILGVHFLRREFGTMASALPSVETA